MSSTSQSRIARRVCCRGTVRLARGQPVNRIILNCGGAINEEGTALCPIDWEAVRLIDRGRHVEQMHMVGMFAGHGREAAAMLATNVRADAIGTTPPPPQLLL